MGNCLGKTESSPEYNFERLNEHNDRYFDRVHARNSNMTTRRRWWRRNHMALTKSDDNAAPSDPNMLSATIPEKNQTIGDTGDGQLSSLLSAWSPTSLAPTLTNSTITNTDSYSNLLSTNRHQRRKSVDAPIDGWQVKRKGTALQMRLANNRLLQLAAGADIALTDPEIANGPLSPVTLDSALQSPIAAASKNSTDVFSKIPPSHHSTDANNHWNTDFESNGMVWVEIERKVQVTAVAMSNNDQHQTLDLASGHLPTQDHPRPLLMALGDQDGRVTVTELLDEHRHPLHHVASDSALRKFGETLEFALQIQGRIRSIDFSPDNRYLVVGGDGCLAVILLIVLDPSSHSLQDLRILQQVERCDRIYSCQFHPTTGASLAISGFDGKIAIGSVEGILSFPTGDKSIPLKEITRFGLIYCFDWSPTGKHYAVGGSDKQCAIYEESGKLVHELLRPTGIQTMRWNHDGSQLAIGDREVTILDGKDFQVKCEISNAPDDSSSPSSPRNKYRIESLCWSPDGTFLAIGGSDGICLVVETKGYALVHEVHRPGAIFCLAWGQRVLNGEYGRYLAVADASRNVALIKAGAEVEGSETDEASSAASSSHFSTGSDWVLREDCFRDIDDAKSQELPSSIKPQGTITAVAFSRSTKTKASSYLAYAADDCSLTIMTTRDWKAVFQMEFAKPLQTLVFSRSSNYLALGGDEGVLYVLSVPSRSIIFNTIFNSTITTVVFSRHDERLAVGTKDGVLTLLCPDADWEPVGELDYSESPIFAQAWSSKTLAVGREDGCVAIFDTEKAFSNFFVPVAEYSHACPVRCLALGVSGRFLAIGGESGVVSVLSSKGGWVLCNQFKMGCSILTANWSPAGRYLAFAGLNKTCRIIDTITWTEVSEIQEATSVIFQDDSVSAISSIDWSMDGKWVALGSSGGGIHVLGTAGWQLLTPSIRN